MTAFSRLLTSTSQPLLLSSIKKLSKYKLSLWVTATGASGFLMVSPAITASLLSACGGIFLCSAAANTFNQIIERNTDSLMARTKNRPLPRNLLTPYQAGIIGSTFTIFGGLMLYMSGGLYPMALALTNIEKTQWNTHIGSVVGCIPPLIGCLAAGGNLLVPQPWLLFGMMYIWQLPHFYTLSWLYRNDYNKVSFKVYGIDDDSGRKTASASVKWITVLSAFPLLCNITGLIPPELLMATVIPNIFITQKALNFYKNPTNKTVNNLFIHSLWHILVLMGLTSYYLRTPNNKNETNDELTHKEPMNKPNNVII